MPTSCVYELTLIRIIRLLGNLMTHGITSVSMTLRSSFTGSLVSVGALRRATHSAMAVSTALVAAFFLTVACVGQANAATVVVTSTGDESDASIGDGSCDIGLIVNEPPVPRCTLRAAIEEINASSDSSNRIEFNIPASDTGCDSRTGVCVIKLTWTNILPDIIKNVVIDGTTQPSNAEVCTTSIPDRPVYKIVIEGDSAEINASDSNNVGGIGLRLEEGSNGSTIKGLNIRNFSDAVALIRSNNSKIACNFIGTNESGTAAGHSSGAGNQLNGVILGCKSTGNTIGGASVNDGNLISASKSSGISLFGDIPCRDGEAVLPLADRSPDGNAMLGNFIGTQKDGISPLGHEFDAINMFGGDGPDNNLIGLMSDGSGGFLYNPNVLAASLSGVYIDSNVSGAVIAGNFIGTDLSGTVDLGNDDGVYIVGNGSATVVRIGGPQPADKNLIALNRRTGIVVRGASASVRIQRNSMYDNDDVGIDLVPVTNPSDPFSDTDDGVTPNDVGDADTGPNALQNFPEPTLATLSGGSVSITYSVPSTAPPLTVEFFTTDSGGQGKTFLGSGTYSAPGVTTLVLPAGTLAVGDHIVGTATDANNNTSEFSASRVTVVALASAAADTGSDVVNSATGTPGTNLFANDTGVGFALTSIGGCNSFPCVLNVLNASSASIGSVTVQNDGDYIFTATAIGAGSAIAYNATDGSSQTVSATLTLTGLAPGGLVAANDNANVNGNSTFTQSISIVANDSGNGITLTSVTGSGAPCGAFPCMINTAHGSVTVQANGTYSYTPTNGYAGPDSFSYVITDIAAQTALGSVNIIVSAAANEAPVPVPTHNLGATLLLALLLAGLGGALTGRRAALAVRLTPTP
ncbi:MAG: CSLREA domain-containing protein [Betaproteobacteria bacterium]|nr:MAG: CSLREA domain-containing protein [Betaproteobacteria bacterium]